MFLKSLSVFQYVEHNGKDIGINVRKKAETLLTLINDTGRIKRVREKAAATRNKYLTAITFTLYCNICTMFPERYVRSCGHHDLIDR